MFEQNYLKYRGKCKEACEELISKDSSLRLVRGHYWCPIWNKDEQHWWCENKSGEIIDPTKSQFPSNGLGIYTEFDGTVCCEQCGKNVPENEARFESNYAFCSTRCLLRCVGL